MANARVVTGDGLVTFQRRGNSVEFRLNYCDAPQRTDVARLTPEDITAAIDRLRAAAVAGMRTVIDTLAQALLPQLDENGDKNDFVDPEFGKQSLACVAERDGTTITVTIPPFYSTLNDDQPGGASDRFLAGEYVRAIIHRRELELQRLFEEARRDLIDELDE